MLLIQCSLNFADMSISSRRRPGNRLFTCQEVTHKTPRLSNVSQNTHRRKENHFVTYLISDLDFEWLTSCPHSTRKILPMIARFTSSRSSVDLNAVTLFPIKMAAHVVAGLRNEAIFYATNLQGKTVLIHGGIWTVSTTWGEGDCRLFYHGTPLACRWTIRHAWE